MIDLSIIIVSYNTKELLQNCLASIQESSGFLSYEVIVVDNNSNDGSMEAISRFQSLIPNLKLIRNNMNLGFSKANNLGVKKSQGEYLLFLNPDTVLHKDTLEMMFKFMNQNKEVGVATCKVILPNGRLDDACHRGFPTPWNSFCYFTGLSHIFPRSKILANYSMGWKDFTSIHEIDACCGAFMFVLREAGEQINWWDEDYFWYGEDLDFCYKLKEKKWKVYYNPETSILHYKGVSGGIKNVSKHLTTASLQTKKKATKARFEAMRIFYKKHYENKYPKLVTWLVNKGISLKEKSIIFKN